MATLCLTIGYGTFRALRSQSLRRLDRVLTEQKEQNLRFDTAINNMTQALCFFDANRRLIVCNDRYADLYKLPRGMLKPGTTLEEIVDHRYAVGCFPKMGQAEYLRWRNGIAISDLPSDTVTEQSDGRTIAIHHQPMESGGWVATHEDITERRRIEERVERMARQDALTGLANRVLFREQLEKHIQISKNGRPVALLSLDLDGFKSVNDTLGHPVGDDLLRAVAGRLATCVRESDVIARLGGDEFSILQIGAPQPAAAVALAERLVHAVSEPFDIAGHKVCVGASVGMAVLPGDADNADDLIKRADLALYAAKAGGGEQARLFEPEMDERVRDRRALESDLGRAVAGGELELHFQPIFDQRRQRVASFEALLRWHHPTRGLLMPDVFIPLAEETGIIRELGEWVLHAAFAQATRWPDAIGIAVNLSPVQLKTGDLVGSVAAALAATGLAPSRVDLEITESVLLVENAINLSLLHRLRALGVNISLDDFGVGYSSLSYLRSFPFSKLKIDRSFVRDIASSDQAAAIVRAIAALGMSLDMEIIAEGVEHADQLRTLQGLGCDHAQGFHLGRPGRPSQFASLMEVEASADRAFVQPRLALVKGV
ncbi:MAG: EAL domain-containing protein [Anaerolineaceae bacterium]